MLENMGVRAADDRVQRAVLGGHRPDLRHARRIARRRALQEEGHAAAARDGGDSATRVTLWSKVAGTFGASHLTCEPPRPKNPSVKLCSGARFRAFPDASCRRKHLIKSDLCSASWSRRRSCCSRHRGRICPSSACRAGIGGARVQPPAGQRSRRPELPPLPVTQIDPRDTTLDSPRRLSLTFLEPRPIDEVLALLITGTPFSLSIDADAIGLVPRRAEAAHAARGVDDDAGADRSRLRSAGHRHSRPPPAAGNAAVRSEPAQRAAWTGAHDRRLGRCRDARLVGGRPTM